LNLASCFDGIILEVAVRALKRFEEDVAEERNSEEEQSGFALLDRWHKSTTKRFDLAELTYILMTVHTEAFQLNESSIILVPVSSLFLRRIFPIFQGHLL
jgi:hypothetical protein